MVKDKKANTSPEENDSSTHTKKVSLYDWSAFGFKIYQDNDSIEKHILTGTNLMKSILDDIDRHGDGEMTEECFSRYKGNLLVRELLSKMIVAHRSEWSYSGSALDNVMVEYEKYYDSMINKLNPDGSRESEIQKEKKTELDRVRAKIDRLSFLSKIKIEGNSQLPSNCFYYFHPQAFVEQMLRISNGRVISPIDCPYVGDGVRIREKHPVTGVVGKAHKGVDLTNYETSCNKKNVYAPIDGEIIKTVNSNSVSGTGTMIVLMGADGFTHKFMHLSYGSIIKNKGHVNVGDKIAAIGSTGGSTGPHLHYEIRDVSDLVIDPLAYNTDLRDNAKFKRGTIDHYYNEWNEYKKSDKGADLLNQRNF